MTPVYHSYDQSGMIAPKVQEWHPNLDSNCSGLNRFGPHRLMCFNAWFIGSDIIRRCGLIREDVALLDEVLLCEGGALR